MNENYVVVTGTPVEGFSIWGPFRDVEAAKAWVGTRVDDWVVVKLDRPEESTYTVMP